MANINAVSAANVAAGKARRARLNSEDESIRYLAQAVENLAKAVAEIAQKQQ